MATNTWNGGGSGNNWNTTGNWSLGHAPLSSEDVVFDATSSKNCTIDPISVSILSLTATAYTGTITGNVSLVMTIAGNCVWADGGIVFGNGSRWNVGGDFGSSTSNASGSDMTGTTVNLTGTNNNFYNAGSYPQSGPPAAPFGILNFQAGCNYHISNAGFVYIVANICGTCTADSEFNVGRDFSYFNQGIHTDIYIKAGGVLTGSAGGSLIFGGDARIMQQDGTFDIPNFGIFGPTDGMVIVPGTYASAVVTLYAVLSALHTTHFAFSPGTYHFTGSGNNSTLSLFNDTPGSASEFHWVLPAGCTVNFSHQTVNLTSALATFTWTDSGGLVKFSNGVTFTPSASQMGQIEFSGGAPVLQSALLADRVTISGGTFNAAGFNVTLRDDLIIASPGQFTPTGLNGSTWTVGGSLLAQGVNGTHLNWHATASWTLNVANGPLNTANASYVDVKNCAAGGGKTIQADHSTDAGSNTGWNFSPSANRPVTSVVARASQTLAAGMHTLEVDMAGTTLTVAVDGPQVMSYVGATLNQGVTKHGFASYFDGTYAQCPLDNFSLPNPSLVPVIPASLSVTTPGGLATWHVSTGATSYTLQRSPGGAGTWTTLATQAGISYQDSVGSLTGDYDYRVLATNAHGSSAYCTPFSVNYPPQTLVVDHFTDTNGTGLASHTPDVRPGSNAWSMATGTLTIQSNQLQVVAGGIISMGLIDAGNADATATVKIQSTSNGLNFRTQEVVGRASDFGNYFAFRYQAGALRLVKQAAFGGETVLASPSNTINTGDTLGIYCHGNTIEGLVNGVSVCSVTDSFNNTTTNFGVKGLNNIAGEVLFDDFQVVHP